MTLFDINGAQINFDEKLINYNAIRNEFMYYSKDSLEKYNKECQNIKNIKQLNNYYLDYGNDLILVGIRKGVEAIISYGVMTVDVDIFKDKYCKKYLNFERIYNNTIKEISNISKNKKNNFSYFSCVDSTISKIRKELYNDCFSIHLAVIDALIDNKITSISEYIDEESIIKSNALFNNYKEGFISTPYDSEVITQIIKLNPYREDVYQYLIKEDGDFGNQIENLGEFLGYDLVPYKNTLMDEYIESLLSSEYQCLNSLKEKITKYAKYIGLDSVDLYLARVDAIYTFENA